MPLHVQFDRKGMPDHCYTPILGVDRITGLPYLRMRSYRRPVQSIHADNSALLLLESARIPADLEYLFAQPTEQQLLTISFRLFTSFLTSLGSLTTRVLRSANSRATPH